MSSALSVMGCHLYDSTHYKVMTIVIYDMQFEDTKAQYIMCTKFNNTMVKHGHFKPNFKKLLDNALANWNVVRIVYDSRDASVIMIDKKYTCLLHWTQSLDIHTKQLIKLEL